MMQTFLLGDLIDIKHGYAFKGEFFSDEGSMIVVTPGNFIDTGGFKLKSKEKYYLGEIPQDYIFDKGDLAIAMTEQMDGLLGSSILIPESKRFLHNQRIGRVTIKDESILDKAYLYYLFNSLYVRRCISVMATGTKIRHTSPSSIYKISVDLPSIARQKSIAELLSSLDEKIELNRQMNKTLEETGKALFRYYFIDNPEAESWQAGKLEDILNITMGQSPPGSSYNTNGEGTTFYQGRAEFGIRFPSKRLSTVDPKRLASRGDVLLSVRAPVGDINQANENCCIGRGLAALTSKNNFESYCYYLMSYLRPRFSDFNSDGTVFGAINGKQLNELKISLAPDSLQREFNDTANDLDAQIWRNDGQNRALIILRDTLLPRLIPGNTLAK